MSKTLYLMRHAKAEQVPYKSDFDRLLTDRGMMDARHQGHRAFKSSIPDRFVVSSALRTMQTAQYIQEDLRFSEDIIQYEESMYLGSLRELLEIINHLEDRWKSVCLIGHNPTISYLAEYLTGEDIGELSTSGIVKINFDGSWSEISQHSALFEYYLPNND